MAPAVVVTADFDDLGSSQLLQAALRLSRVRGLRVTPAQEVVTADDVDGSSH